MKPKKIALIGPPGSGKTTLSRQLSQLLNLPIYHLDQHLWLPGGVKRKKSVFVKIQKEIVAKPKWIIEGCGTSTFEIRYSQADWVLYLNYSRWICIWRSLKRFLFERNKHPDTPEGCSKVFHFELIRYIWKFKADKGPGIYQLRDQYPTTLFSELKNSKETSDLIKNFSKS